MSVTRPVYRLGRGLPRVICCHTALRPTIGTKIGLQTGEAPFHGQPTKAVAIA
jgi:hypothetical protein